MKPWLIRNGGMNDLTKFKIIMTFDVNVTFNLNVTEDVKSRPVKSRTNVLMGDVVNPVLEVCALLRMMASPPRKVSP